MVGVLSRFYALRGALALQTFDSLNRWENLTIVLLGFFTCGWFFALGSCIGSFLNVVVYRMPLGRQVLRGSSHCPSCGERILSRDNIPIFGWLWLRGRCRFCQWRIPFRYAGVELLTGGLFLALLVAELLSGGRNLPNRTPNAYSGVAGVIWSLQGDLFALYAFHLLLVCLLLAMALIEWDRQRVPLRLPIFGLVIALVVSALNPSIQLVPPEFVDWRLSRALTGLTTSIMGLLAGLMVGALMSLATRNPQFTGQARALMLATMLTGSVLGWQACALIGGVTGVLWLGWSLATRIQGRLGSFPGLGWLLVTTMVFITNWKTIHQLTEVSKGKPNYSVLIGGVVASAITAALAGWIWIRRDPPIPIVEIVPNENENPSPHPDDEGQGIVASNDEDVNVSSPGNELHHNHSTDSH